MSEINEILEARKQQKIIVANQIYFVAFAMYTVLNLVMSSMIKSALPNGVMGHVSSLMMLMMVILLGVKLFFYSTTNFKELFIKGLMLLASIVAFPIYGPPIFVTTLFIVTADDINFKELLRKIVKINALCIVIIMLLAKFNIIEDLIYQRGDRTRDSFGFTYVTVFASKVFYTVAAYLYVRGKKVNYKDAIGVGLIALFIQYFCYARLSVCAMLLLLMAVFIAKYIPKLVLNKWIGLVVKNSYWLLAMIIYFLSYTYKSTGIYAKLNHLLSGRLQLGHTALERYDIKVLGQYIYQKGNGGSTTPVPAHEYFFIDASYLRILLMYGLVIFVLFGIIFYFNFRSAYRVQDATFIAILLVIMITGSIDENLLSPVNVFMIGMLSLNNNTTYEGLSEKSQHGKIWNFIKKQSSKA